MRKLICVALLLTAAPASSEHPNVAKGFEPASVYQFNGLDNVNLYNGNLTLRVPLGQMFDTNGALSYSFFLTYNSKAWDQRIDFYDEAQPDYWAGKAYLRSLPSLRSNAGMGWLFSFGRLLKPSDWRLYPGTAGTTASPWVYESPDGNDHRFIEDAGVAGSVGYTRDGSFLRIKHLASSHEVHFPDGSVHLFSDHAEPELQRITDPYGNYLAFTYGLVNGRLKWTIAEYTAGNTLVRQHYAYFEDVSGSLPADTPQNYDFVLDELQIAKFSGGHASYVFEYSIDTVRYGGYGDSRNYPPYYNETPDPVVPRLTSITLPESLDWQFAYHTAYAGSPDSSLKSVKYPSGGITEWEYTTWEMPTKGCRPYHVVEGDELWSPFSRVEGVWKKTMKGAGPDGADAVWTYGQDSRSSEQHEAKCWQISGDISFPEVEKTIFKRQESVVTVTNPDSTQSQHFFSVWVDVDGASQLLFHETEYGLPFTRFVGRTASSTGVDGQCRRDDPYALCLSSRQLDGAGQVLRQTYVRYHGETRSPDPNVDPTGFEQYRREAESLTKVFDEPVSETDAAGPAPFIRVLRDEYDGLGHYRKTTTSDSWTNTTRVEYTRHNPAEPEITINSITWASSPDWKLNRPGSGEKWLLNLYDQKSVNEGDKTLTTEFAFDGVTGFLNRVRTLERTDGSQSTYDLITAYTKDALGNMIEERYYGGDVNTVGTGTLASLLLGSPEYTIANTYQHGTISRSVFKSGASEFLERFNATIHQGTGLVASTTDAAGVQTEYNYDALGRLVEIDPTGRAERTYTYTAPSGGTNATVVVKALTQGGSELTRTTYEYDGHGRVIKEMLIMPGGSESRRETMYDGMGRQLSVSELGTGELARVSYEYDALGRTKKVIAPDGAITTFGYDGAWEKTRTTKVQTTASSEEIPVSVKETFDGLGRLTSVTEQSGPTSSTDAVGIERGTAYLYDPAGRLSHVSMEGAEATQHRIFEYDGRGFLMWESHPESGMAAYTYDSRGNVLSREVGAAETQYDLEYEYDDAGRILNLRGRNPFFGESGQTEFRVVKEYTYATANSGSNLRKGKLWTARRYNYDRRYHPDYYTVTETYEYAGGAGRASARETLIQRWGPAGEDFGFYMEPINISLTYNDLDDVASLTYPSCLGCGTPPYDMTRKTVTTFDRGYPTSLTVTQTNPPQGYTPYGAVVAMTYHPNGLWSTLVHKNGITDTQTLDTNGAGLNLARPKSISAAEYGVCSAPEITTHPKGGVANPSITLTVTATGTELLYQWYADGDEIPGATASSIQVSPSQATTYEVEVTNECSWAEVWSDPAIVTTGSCVTPQIQLAQFPVKNGDGSWTLTAEVVSGRNPYQIEWRTSPGGSVFSTDRTVTVNPAASTTYYVTVSDSCGSATDSVWIEVALPAPTNLTATRTGSTQITVTWGAVAGSPKYRVERRSGGDWSTLPDQTGTTLVDSVSSGRAYAYRVRAVTTQNNSISPYSNTDVATTQALGVVTQGASVAKSEFDKVLAAVNEAREAAGWPALTWSTLLGPDQPLPAPSATIYAQHVRACRARMNEALEAVGARIGQYTRADVTKQVISAADLNEVIQNAQ
jgi:YD repeat-containing protein